jgi:hypothetical protein
MDLAFNFIAIIKFTLLTTNRVKMNEKSSRGIWKTIWQIRILNSKKCPLFETCLNPGFFIIECTLDWFRAGRGEFDGQIVVAGIF